MKPEVAALLRTHFWAFLRKAFRTVSPSDEYLRNWHIDAIMHQLDGVTSGKLTRLIINHPQPGNGCQDASCCMLVPGSKVAASF